MASKELVYVSEDDQMQHECRVGRGVSQDDFVLTKVVGLTNISKNSLDCNQVTGYVAFPASCVLVLLNPKTNDQKFIKGPSGRSISCVSFSDDGRLVALGESGIKPIVSVWSLKDHKEQGKFVIDHSVGVKTIAIHPKLSYVVVIGAQDLHIGVWDYVRCQRLALTKWQTAPLALTIPKSGSSVILCGHRKITLFNLSKVSSNSYETNVFEDRKAVLLGRQSEYTFIDITSGKGKFDKSVYTVTTCGYLCEVRLGDILIDKASKVDTHAYCVRFALNHVFIGCCEGVVKICSPETLNVAVAVSLDQLLGSAAFPQAASKLHLETTALTINEKDSIVTCIYANCSMYSWQINSFADNIECSVLLPPSDGLQDNSEIESTINESVCRANMFRSLMGCLEFNKYSRLFDTEKLAARNGLCCHHDLVHLIKGSTARNQQVTTFRFSPDGRDVICGNEAGEIKVYEASTGVLRRVIEAHSAQVMCIELLYDEEYQLVCTGGRDRIIFILNAKADFGLVQVLCDHSAAITAISLVSYEGLLTLVSAAADNLILVRRATPGNSLKFTVTGQIADSRFNKALNVTGDYIITGDKNGNIKLFKADPIFNPKLSKTLKNFSTGHQITSMPKPMCVDPTGSFIATAQNPGQIVVYHLLTGQPVASLSSQTDASTIKFTSCLKYLISSTSNGCTMIWKIPERMTEFLIAKRNRSFQIEVAKEISYETTYVSCLKICKEMTVRESGRENDQLDYTRPNSNHNYDTDATPSIESLSFLRVACHESQESDRNSTSNTESYISCSTCRDSCSDTIHWCPSTDSSVQTNSGMDRYCFANGDICDRIIEDGGCVKLGPFRRRSNDTVPQRPVTDEVPVESADNTSIKCQQTMQGKSSQKKYVISEGFALENTNSFTARTDVIIKELSDLHSQIETAEQVAISDKMSHTATSGFVSGDYTLAEPNGTITAIASELKATSSRRVVTSSHFNESVYCRSGLENKIDLIKKVADSATFEDPFGRQKIAPLHVMDLEEPRRSKNNRTDNGNMLLPNHGHPPTRKHSAIPHTSPRNIKRLYGGISSPTSVGSYKTACSPKPTISMDTSCSPGNSIFYSPSPCFSSESDEMVSKFHSSNVKEVVEGKEDEKVSQSIILQSECGQRSSPSKLVETLNKIPSSNVVAGLESNRTSPCASSLPNTSTVEAIQQNAFIQDSSQKCEPNNKLTKAQVTGKKDSLQKKALKGGCKSKLAKRGAQLSGCSSILAKGGAQLSGCSSILAKGGAQLSGCSSILAKEGAQLSGCSSIFAKEEAQLSGCSSILAKNSDLANAEQSVSCTSKNETSVRKCEDVDSDGHLLEGCVLGDMQLSLEHSMDIQANGEAKLTGAEGNVKTNSEQTGEETVYNYHSITRDESGKLRLVANMKKNVSTSSFVHHAINKSSTTCSMDIGCSNDHSETHQKLQELSLQNVQCSMCTHAEDINALLVLDSNSLSGQDRLQNDLDSIRGSYRLDNEKGTSLANSSSNLEAFSEPQRCVDASRREFIKDMNEQRLEEYFSELRQCLQLTNSQETVYKLACDVQDQELMGLLELVLNKRPSAFIETFSLPPDQIEMINRSLAEPDHREQQTTCETGETVCDFRHRKDISPIIDPSLASNQVSHEIHVLNETMTKADPPESDTFAKSGRELFNHCPINKIQDGEEYSESTAKAIISLVGQILTSRRAAQEGRAKAESAASASEKSQDMTAQSVTESKYSCSYRTLSCASSQLKSSNDSQSPESSINQLKTGTQQYMTRAARTNSRQLKGSCHLEVLKEGGEEKSEDSEPPSELSISNTNRTVHTTRRLAQMSSHRTLDLGRDNSAKEKLPSLRFLPSEINNDCLGDRTESHTTTWANASPEKTKRSLPVLDNTSKIHQPVPTRPQTMHDKDGAHELESRNDNQSSNDKPISRDRKYPPPIVELFRDQEEYLKKLKEVREKFEMSIQALSKERKSRLAEDERQQYK